MNITNGWGIKERQIGKKKKRYIDRNIFRQSILKKDRKTGGRTDKRTDKQADDRLQD